MHNIQDSIQNYQAYQESIMKKEFKEIRRGFSYYSDQTDHKYQELMWPTKYLMENTPKKNCIYFLTEIMPSFKDSTDNSDGKLN